MKVLSKIFGIITLILDFHRPLCLSGFETIYRDGVLVGNVRQGDYAFTVGKTVAYGYIKRPDGGKVTMDFVREGKYEIEFMREKYAAFVHTKSPFDPENKRVKGFYTDVETVHETQPDPEKKRAKAIYSD